VPAAACSAHASAHHGVAHGTPHGQSNDVSQPAQRFPDHVQVRPSSLPLALFMTRRAVFGFLVSHPFVSHTPHETNQALVQSHREKNF
jgi:hypothetical protein